MNTGWCASTRRPGPCTPRSDRPARLAWTADSIPAGLRTRLVGPGAPFELVTEDVLGAPHQVFARRPRSLRQVLDTSAAESPDLVFLVAPGREWTYQQAVEDIDAIAVLLAERHGVRAGDRVAIVSANSAEYVLVLWAVLSLGAIVTSLENRLVEHAGIAEAAVVGVDHPELGQEVKAVVVRAPGADGLTAEQVREWCAPALAAFKVPSRIEFRPSLPYTVSGTLLKQQLRNDGSQ